MDPMETFAIVAYFLIDNWPLLAIGMLFGVLFAWKQWVPSKWSYYKGMLLKKNLGVHWIRTKSRKFIPRIANFSEDFSKTPEGAFNHTAHIAGYMHNVPIAFSTQEDPDSVPVFKNDYDAKDLTNPHDFDSALKAERMAGELDAKNDDKRMFWMQVGSILGILILIFFIWDMRSQLIQLGQILNNINGNLASIKGGLLTPGK